jgi:hypothetical protein
MVMDEVHYISLEVLLNRYYNCNIETSIYNPEMNKTENISRSIVADLCHSCFSPRDPAKSRVNKLKWWGNGVTTRLLARAWDKI